MNFEMKSKDNNVYELYIYDEIKPDRVNWEGELVESKTDALKIKADIDAIPDGSTINVYINSNGGDVKTGLAIYSQLARKQCRKTGYVDSFACSIASVILMACDHIIMYPSSLMMIHCASGGFYGNADEHRAYANDLDVISNSATTAYLTKAGDKLNREILDSLLKAESWLSAADCLKYGLCDEVVVPSSGNSTAVEQHKKQMLDMAAKIQGIYSDVTNVTPTAVNSIDSATDKGDITNKEDKTVEGTVDVGTEQSKNSENSDFNNVVDTLFKSIF